MIEAHDLRKLPSAPDVYAEPTAYSERVVIDTLGRIEEHLDRISNFSERQREKAAPEIIDLSPNQGQQSLNSYTTRTRLRLIGVLISGAQGDNLRLSLGSRSFNFWNVVGGPVLVPFPITVDHGIDLSVTDITNPGSVSWSAYVIGYPE